MAVNYRSYDQAEVVDKYRPSSAGQGIQYLIPHVYSPIYLREIFRIMREAQLAEGLSMLEFGAGAAMNSLCLLHELHSRRIPVRELYATDFSPAMVRAATEDAQRYYADVIAPFKALVAHNETILADLAHGLGGAPNQLFGRFQFIFGVNTFRFSWHTSQAQQLYDMLSPGGAVVMIDMNNRHPYLLGPLLSRLRGSSSAQGPKSTLLHDLARIYAHERGVLPTLRQYTDPWRVAGFTIVESTTFSWVPHSANGIRFKLLKAFEPILDAFVKGCAMRTLVVARKPWP